MNYRTPSRMKELVVIDDDDDDEVAAAAHPRGKTGMSAMMVWMLIVMFRVSEELRSTQERLSAS